MTPATIKRNRVIVFSKRRIEELTAPSNGRDCWHDEKTPGLCVRITTKGVKTYYLYKWTAGRPVRVRLGGHPEITVEQARDMAQKLNGEIVQGINPQARKRSARAELTFGNLCDQWMQHAKQSKKTWKEDERLIGKFLGPLKGRRVSDIERADVKTLHARVGSGSGHYQANRVMALVQSIFQMGIDDLGLTGPNPAMGVKRFKEKTRDRYLLPTEIKALMASVAAELPLLRDFFMLALLTGARRGNVQAMAWGDVHLEDAWWRIPETKNNEPVIVPLPAMAVDILHERKKETNGSSWVFPSRGVSGHLVEPKIAWRRVLDRAGIDNLRIHDLRRTLGSWMAGLNYSQAIIGKTLGHKAGSPATAIYSRLALDPVREAAGAATTAMLTTAGLIVDQSKPTKTKSRRGTNGKV